MQAPKSRPYVRWDCKYDVVYIPTYRRKAIYGELNREIRKDSARRV
jgi:putative transposase